MEASYIWLNQVNLYINSISCSSSGFFFLLKIEFVTMDVNNFIGTNLDLVSTFLIIGLKSLGLYPFNCNSFTSMNLTIRESFLFEFWNDSITSSSLYIISSLTVWLSLRALR